MSLGASFLNMMPKPKILKERIAVVDRINNENFRMVSNLPHKKAWKANKSRTNRQRKCQVLLSFELLLIYWKKINNQLKRKTEARLKRGNHKYTTLCACFALRTFFFPFRNHDFFFFRLSGSVMLGVGHCWPESWYFGGDVWF